MSTSRVLNTNPAPRPAPFMARTHSRSLSPRKDKRSSLIVPSYAQFAPATALQAPAREPSPEQNTQETDIMTALAAQERRVLELKEELLKAEKELESLKNQWASHESTKRRNEGRRMHHMRPMSISSAKSTDPNDDPDGSSAWMYEEMEKRKALLGNNTKSSHRRVFSGSRHTKELSLLSPIKMQIDDAGHDTAEDVDTRRSRDPVKQMVPFVPPSSTNDTTLFGNEPALKPDGRIRNDSRSPQREDLIKASKQVATDLRDGLWTFFEDLRQAAVGDEPRQSSNNSSLRPSNSTRATSSRTSPSSNENKSTVPITSEESDSGRSFWKENGLMEPKSIPTSASVKAAKVRTPQKSVINTFDSEGDSWETWGSPDSPVVNANRRTSTNLSLNNSPDTSGASSTDVTMRAKREAIPWPALTKLAPGQLRRTASHLMEELERSLTPPSSENVHGLGRGEEGGFLGATHAELLH